MKKIEYKKFNALDPLEFMTVLNEQSIRSHLIAHGLFEESSVKEWVAGKIEVDAIAGCRVRAVYCDSQLVGWCGLQKEQAHFEVAIVISKNAWGIGSQIFREMMRWSVELRHKEVVIHLLETRPQYKFLQKISTRSYRTQMLGRQFTTYHLQVALSSQQETS
ncbi:MAG: N-acetyltransferase [Oceanospirillaceae bacterium]|nr:N-acetyltransferase [Oceanospirillaceae bacterium]